MDTPIESARAESPVFQSAPADFSQLYQRHSHEIFYLTLRLLGDEPMAQDATHDVFLKAFKKWGDFRGESSSRTWLYRIAINHCSNLRQSWHNRHVFSESDDAIFENAPTKGDSPFRVLEIKELGERIQQTLDQLSEEYRLLLLLVAQEELSYEEIASLTNQTTDAVRGKLHRARRAFAELFQKNPDL